jgi:AcrR family transcriptional regulator
MKTARRKALEPRKRPRQARSTATVEALLEAPIQVLDAEGAPRLTTTRVAERAGVSVGTMYQYFPHKQSLLYAVLQRHLERVAAAVEHACRELQGSSLAAMASGLVNAYLDAKTGDVETSRALYMVSGEMDAEPEGSERTAAAMRMLATATDGEFDDLRGDVPLLAAMSAFSQCRPGRQEADGGRTTSGTANDVRRVSACARPQVTIRKELSWLKLEQRWHGQLDKHRQALTTSLWCGLRRESERTFGAAARRIRYHSERHPEDRLAAHGASVSCRLRVYQRRCL